MDVSPAQIVSGGGIVGPVPGARRRQPRLDGRQHVAPGGAVLRPEKPMVGTGIERVAAVDSGTVVTRRPWRRGGLCDATRIVIRVNDAKRKAGEVGVDIYNLIKYQRSKPEHQHPPAPHRQKGDKLAKVT